jgi:hypothetical protein
MIAPAKAGKFTLYRGERQGFAAERAFAPSITITSPRRSRRRLRFFDLAHVASNIKSNFAEDLPSRRLHMSAKIGPERCIRPRAPLERERDR